ncbi:Acb2/Tad1 domain-containing protein [Streptomyces sp. NPDC002346]
MTADDLMNRFEYHPPRDAEAIRKHAGVRGFLFTAAEFVEANVPDGREKALALTKIEEAMFWANAGIARA